jgi:hypothetical protein
MAAPFMLETTRAHAAVGSFGTAGGQITGATAATPIVITTTSPHLLVSGDQVQVTGVVVNTAANSLAYAKVLSPTTFGMYSDAAMTVGLVGAGVATFAATSVVSQALDISGVTGDFTVRLRVEALTAAKNIQIAIQDSVDGFVADIVTRKTINVKGAVLTGAMLDVIECRKYDIPSMRFGTANARMRINVLAIDAATSATVTCWYEA